MTKVNFYPKTQIEDSLIKFAVCTARYNGQWVFCRHKQRSTWEFPGGHREKGETVEEAAGRELWEETGALKADLRLVAVYEVIIDGIYSYGALFFAEISALGPLPEEMEIGELLFSEKIPERLTYPEILPCLYRQTQGWLNLRNSPDEIWDVYDEDRRLTGRFHRRGDPLEKGDYHLAVHIWIRNSKGEYLITKRTPNKGFPNMWETTGGSALAGDDSLAAALRETKEETGLILDPEKGRCVLSFKREDSFCDVWLFCQDFDLSQVVLQEGETCDAMYASREKIIQMDREGVFVPFSYLKELL